MLQGVEGDCLAAAACHRVVCYRVLEGNIDGANCMCRSFVSVVFFYLPYDHALYPDDR